MIAAGRLQLLPQDKAIGAAAAASAAAAGGLAAGVEGALAALAGLGLTLLALLRPALPKLRLGGRAGKAEVIRFVSELYEDAGIGFAVLTMDGALVDHNASFARLLGTGPGRLDQRAPEDFVRSADRPVLRQAFDLVAKGDAPVRELRLFPHARPEDGVTAVVARAARLNLMCMVVRDAAFAMRLESQVRQATKMQAVGQLAGGLAHDFNNILTAIIGTCDLSLMRQTPGSQDYMDVDQIRQNANRAANLVRQLLGFSRQQTLRPRITNVNEVIGELSHLLRRLLGERVRLRFAQGRELAPVRVDPSQLEQVIVNLAVNARDAMPGGGDLVISTYAVAAGDVPRLGHRMMPSADYVAIAVRDTGQGIPPHALDHVFEPFFTTKEVGKGTGLGLSMAYGIVKQTGGFIFADSPPGQGATFTIYLPALAGEVAEPVVAQAQAPQETWGQGTVLIVEDETMVRAVAVRALTRSGYEVLAAANGEEALAILDRQGTIDLLVSDVVMPGMDGPTVVARARAIQPHLKVLYISGYAEEQIRDRVDGAYTALLRKPFSVNELTAAVRQRLAA